MSVVPRPPRLLSVDLVRGLDVLLMLFVNEMAGVAGTPAFIPHNGPESERITFKDVVITPIQLITRI